MKYVRLKTIPLLWAYDQSQALMLILKIFYHKLDIPNFAIFWPKSAFLPLYNPEIQLYLNTQNINKTIT